MKVWSDPESLSALLTSTLGRPVSAVPSLKKPVKPDDFVGVYAHERRAKAAFVCDLSLAAYTSAALQMFPLQRAAENIKACGLEPELRDNLHEILNICSQLINSSSQQHVSLALLCQFRDAPQWLQECLGSATTQMPVEVSIQGYGRGRMTLAQLSAD